MEGLESVKQFKDQLKKETYPIIETEPNQL